MQLNVLFIDDESDICELFLDEFSSDLIQVRAFTDHHQAIEDAIRDTPDVAFIDFRVPGTTGEKIALAMAESIPKYLMTGEIDPKTAYKFNGIFGKPPNYEEIRSLLQTMLKAKQSAWAISVCS